MPNNAINSDVQKRRFALLLRAGYFERYVLKGLRIMESVKIQISLVAGLFKLQAGDWQSKIRYEIRFFLCGISTYISFAILKPLGDMLAGKENELIAYMFDNPPFALLVLLTVVIGYFGLYLSVIAAALFTSLLPKT